MNTYILTRIMEGYGFLAESALIVTTVRRSLWKTMPVFASLCFYSVVEDVILIVAYKVLSDNAYFWAYSVFALGDYILQIALMVEIARHVLKPAGTWIGNARQQLATCSALGAAVALLPAVALAAPGLTYHHALYMRASLFTSLLVCCCFLATTVIANRLRLPRKRHTMIVGQGLAAWNIGCLGYDVALGTGASPHTEDLIDVGRQLVWIGVVTYWATSLWVARTDHGRRSLEHPQLALLRHLGGEK